MTTIYFNKAGNTVFAYTVVGSVNGRNQEHVYKVWETETFTKRKQDNFIKEQIRMLCGNVIFENKIF